MPEKKQSQTVWFHIYGLFGVLTVVDQKEKGNSQSPHGRECGIDLECAHFLFGKVRLWGHNDMWQLYDFVAILNDIWIVCVMKVANTCIITVKQQFHFYSAYNS